MVSLLDIHDNKVANSNRFVNMAGREVFGYNFEVEITKVPAKILAKKTGEVAVADIKNGLYKELILDMRKAMVENNGVGLAANQVGKNLSIFVIDQKLAEENNVPDVFINPEITEYSKETDETEEGCLSIPDYWMPIKRSKKIKIKAIDENGNKIKFKAKGFLARVLQHETDHLNGMTIKDRHSKISKSLPAGRQANS